MAVCLGLPGWAGTRKDFTEARDSEWQWHQLGHMQVCTSLQTDNYASTPPLSILQAGCPSCCPTNSVKALKAKCTLWIIVVNSVLTNGVLTAAASQASVYNASPRPRMWTLLGTVGTGMWGSLEEWTPDVWRNQPHWKPLHQRSQSPPNAYHIFFTSIWKLCF